MKIIGAIILAAVLTVMPRSTLPVLAADSSAVIRVSATVLPWLRLNARQHVTRYRVTNGDLVRGYVDLPGWATVSIRTNERRTIGVTVQNEGNVKVIAKLSGTNVYEDPGRVLVIGQPQKGTEISRELDIRVYLPEGTREGFYPLDLAISPYTY